MRFKGQKIFRKICLGCGDDWTAFRQSRKCVICGGRLVLFIRCGYAKGGGGRTCPLRKGHKGDHVFECGR